MRDEKKRGFPAGKPFFLGSGLEKLPLINDRNKILDLFFAFPLRPL